MTVSKNPLVSVVMATFNESQVYINESVSSILNQTYSNLELLIFDDSTNEETMKALDNFLYDYRVRIIRFDERVGFVKSLNLGLSEAKGKYIARMDGDDFSYPERLEKEVAYLESHPDVSVIGGQMDVMDENSKVVSHRNYPLKGFKLWLFSCFRNPMAHPTVMLRRDIVDLGYRYNEKLSLSEDLDFWLRLLNDDFKIANLEDTLIKYRVQSNFVEKRTTDKQRNYMFYVRKINFDKNHLAHSCLSVLAGWIFNNISLNAVKKFYKKENNS